MRYSDESSILVADDDADDRLMIGDALKESGIKSEIYFVHDGEELLDFLLHRNAYVNPDSSPRPALVLLDLNMPKKDGREALAEIRHNPKLKGIPIVALTTSKAPNDIARVYDLGVNSYIAKPETFDGLVRLLKDLGRYWFEVVELPAPKAL